MGAQSSSGKSRSRENGGCGSPKNSRAIIAAAPFAPAARTAENQSRPASAASSRPASRGDTRPTSSSGRRAQSAAKPKKSGGKHASRTERNPHDPECRGKDGTPVASRNRPSTAGSVEAWSAVSTPSTATPAFSPGSTSETPRSLSRSASQSFGSFSRPSSSYGSRPGSSSDPPPDMRSAVDDELDAARQRSNMSYESLRMQLSGFGNAVALRYASWPAGCHLRVSCGDTSDYPDGDKPADILATLVRYDPDTNCCEVKLHDGTNRMVPAPRVARDFRAGGRRGSKIPRAPTISEQRPFQNGRSGESSTVAPDAPSTAPGARELTAQSAVAAVRRALDHPLPERHSSPWSQPAQPKVHNDHVPNAISSMEDDAELGMRRPVASGPEPSTFGRAYADTDARFLV
eukprot:TRINITY_DN27700_c0_g1_i1.p1 TRINITY_DN27700_c0_g1~~TRINITY_DN27700_c0_g1_i1.p1  ORF type:complete len:430 (-),score=20.06 TRINITY_DN27700_c0_g1_i1:358-1566(-)